jgi:hypothetical protein
MSFQSALETLAGTFISLYLACAAAGRPDIPLRIVSDLRARALASTTASWGCPSVFYKESCSSYDHARYSSIGLKKH